MLVLLVSCNPPIEKDEMEEIFTENYELMMIVVNYFKNSGHERIGIRDGDERGQIRVGGGHIAETGDIEFIEAVETLRKRGFRNPTRSGNTIRFLRWSRPNVGHGIAYSINGLDPIEAEIWHLTRLEPLSVPNWFYYESDFNEWRRQNPRPPLGE